MANNIAKSWRLLAENREQAASLAERLGVSTVVGQLLLNRGISDEATARHFLGGGLEDLHDPFLLQDMESAVARIQAAIAKQEKITVYGDYDVDGITATALLYNTLRDNGAVVEYYIPERQSEGYGLHAEAMEKIASSGTGLLITVDCGISSWHEVKDASSQMDIIITDHHQPPERLPEALAVINPKQPGCTYPDKDLAGVGVAFKVCQALWRQLGNAGIFARYLDLVAVGTVADMVPLTGENRILVRCGLDVLRQTDNAGLKALLDVCDIKSSDVDSGKIGYVLAPRLNAAGRLSHATAGVELLTSSDSEQVGLIAAELNVTNGERQDVERQILAKAEEQLKGVDWQNVKALVVAGKDWHPGVIGIVASRLVERYHRPTVMISVRDGIGKGSCRSISGFDMYSGLQRCADLLIQYGGHRQAAGLSLKQEDIPRFAERLNAVAGEVLSDEDYIPVLRIDAMVSLSEVNDALIEQLASLAPYGVGNPSPLLACAPVALQSSAAFGKEKQHLRLWIKENAANSEVIAWNKGEMASQLDCRYPAEVAFVPEIHEWQGRRSVRMRAIDVRQADVLPDRLAVGKVYLVLKGLSRQEPASGIQLNTPKLLGLLLTHYGISMDEQGLAFSLCVLAELNLIRVDTLHGEKSVAILPSPDKKLDIAASPTFRMRLRQSTIQKELLPCNFKN